jgi:hypothetical protein
MAAEDVQDTEPAPELPPEQPLPAAAADAAQIGPAPTPEETLLPAAYGDKGAQQYQALRAAGQQAPTPAPPTSVIPPGMLPGNPNVGGLQYVLGGGGAAAPSPLMDLFGGPGAAGKMQVQQLQRQQAVTKLQQERQSMAVQGLDFLEKLRTNNVPINVRVAMIQEMSARTGQPLTPAQSAYIAHLTNDPNLLDHLATRIKNGDVNAYAEYQSLFSGDPTKMISAADEIRKGHAEADKAVSEAAMAQAKEPYAGTEAKQKVDAAQLAITRQGGGSPNPPTPAREIQANAAVSPDAPNGHTYVMLKVPGVTGATAWYAVPRDEKNQPVIPPELMTDAHAAAGPVTGGSATTQGHPGAATATAPPSTAAAAAISGESTAQRTARLTAEAKQPPAMAQRTLSQISTALAPIQRLEGMFADPKYKDTVAKMGPQYTVTNPITGSTRSLPFTQDTEGTAHDSVSHPLNVMWYNYKQGGKDMTPQEREVMATLGTISASGWQGLTSGIRNRAVIEDVKQHVPRPWDDPDLVRAKIDWIKQWYGAIKTGITSSAQTLKDLQDADAANPFNIPDVQPGGAGATPGARGTPPASAQGTTALPTVATPEDAAKLAPGTHFRTPDGQERVRQ